jgi:deoxyhypusine synthase
VFDFDTQLVDLMSFFFFGMKLDWRLADEEITEDCSDEERELAYRESVRCKLFLGFTSNLVSSGVRDTIRYLVQHHMVS